jgi:hypothetical protein
VGFGGFMVAGMAILVMLSSSAARRLEE